MHAGKRIDYSLPGTEVDIEAPEADCAMEAILKPGTYLRWLQPRLPMENKQSKEYRAGRQRLH